MKLQGQDLASFTTGRATIYYCCYHEHHYYYRYNRIRIFLIVFSLPTRCSSVATLCNSLPAVTDYLLWVLKVFITTWTPRPSSSSSSQTTFSCLWPSLTSAYHSSSCLSASYRSLSVNADYVSSNAMFVEKYLGIRGLPSSLFARITSDAASGYQSVAVLVQCMHEMVLQSWRHSSFPASTWFDSKNEKRVHTANDLPIGSSVLAQL